MGMQEQQHQASKGKGTVGEGGKEEEWADVAEVLLTPKAGGASAVHGSKSIYVYMYRYIYIILYILYWVLPKRERGHLCENIPTETESTFPPKRTKVFF